MSDLRPEPAQDLDARIDVEEPATAPARDETPVLLREGADAPDAADIEDPERQR